MQADTFFPKVRRMLLCFSPFNFLIFLASFHAASRAPCSCHSVSSWDRSSNFGALGLRWWGSPGQINPNEGFWPRFSVWRAIAFVNFTHRIGFCMSELLRKIDDNFSGSMSWKTQPNCRVFDELHPTGPWFDSWRLSRSTTGCPVLSCNSYFFNKATALLSSFFLDLYLVVHQPDDVHTSTFHQICNHSWSWRTSILEGPPFSQNELVQVPLR